MFTTLLESRPQRHRPASEAIVSVATHSLLIFGAVQATVHAASTRETVERMVRYVEARDDQPPPPRPQVPPPPPGFQVLTAPVSTPNVLPEIDLSRKITDERDFSGVALERHVPAPSVAASPVEGTPYLALMVEKPVVEAPGTVRPRYPDFLNSVGIEAEVLAQFVVETAGRVEIDSFRILRQSHELFAAAVRTALPGMRFLPA